MPKSLRTREHRAVCAALKTARERAGLSQAQLAQRLRRPQSFIAKTEGGERRLDVVEFVQIARALRVHPRDLLAAVVPYTQADMYARWTN